MPKRIGVYPGTFDPITNGHVDVIKRACNVVDHLIIGVATNLKKEPLFSIDERIDMVEHETSMLSNIDTKIEALPLNCLLVNFASDVGASIIIRGLRAVSDFEYEFKMCVMNSRLDSNIETLFLMASERTQFTSSLFVKEIGSLGGDISSFVSPYVKKKLQKRFLDTNK
ncbi:MAG: pantetheine-phosphate adenylyltransferase [Alphaproteobacteria bacterium]|nr:pantetheine-phosphate adenylyltransferase [Alphaproteobacteria bacterium]